VVDVGAVTDLAAESCRIPVATVTGTDLVAESRRIPVATVVSAARFVAKAKHPFCFS
jgi:hypothetical protein